MPKETDDVTYRIRAGLGSEARAVRRIAAAVVAEAGGDALGGVSLTASVLALLISVTDASDEDVAEIMDTVRGAVVAAVRLSRSGAFGGVEGNA